MSLSQMIEKAQRFKDFKGAESSKTKKTLRTTKTSSVTDQLKTELVELKTQMATLQASLENKSSTIVQSSRKVSSAGIVEDEATLQVIARIQKWGMGSHSI